MAEVNAGVSLSREQIEAPETEDVARAGSEVMFRAVAPTASARCPFRRMRLKRSRDMRSASFPAHPQRTYRQSGNGTGAIFNVAVASSRLAARIERWNMPYSTVSSQSYRLEAYRLDKKGAVTMELLDADRRWG
jgi:hypothetical protein